MVKSVKLIISDEIDLHAFRPDEVEALLLDYFTECIQSRIFSVRVVHGKGTGVLKKKVRAALSRNPLVTAFQDAPPDSGGWGATRVELRRNKKRAKADHRRQE